jgi:glycosyltransferase involved in cell wall biosynthesis
MKLIYFTGDSYPPTSGCAVEEAAFNTIEWLKTIGYDVEIVTGVKWTLSNVPYLKKHLRASSAEAVYFPYHSLLHSWSLAPHLFSILNSKKVVVQIHEVSQIHILRRMSLALFTLCRAIVFTNEYEMNLFLKIFPWTPKYAVRVIPIASNIKPISVKSYSERQKSSIVYFGLIRPQKGLESVLELASLIKNARLEFRIIIIGRILPRWRGYLAKLHSKIQPDISSIIDWEFNASEERVSEILGSTLYAFLPFDDGASERRGSLFAALAHRMVIFTTKGLHTPSNLKECVYFVDCPQQVINLITDPILMTEDHHNQKLKAIRILMKRYDWPSIVEDYNLLFLELHAEKAL